MMVNPKLSLKKSSSADCAFGFVEKKRSVLSARFQHRSYTDAAGMDYLGMLGWGGYGLKMHETKQTVLLKMIEEGANK